MKSFITAIAVLFLPAGCALETCFIVRVLQGGLQSIDPSAVDLVFHAAASLLIAFSLTVLLAHSRAALSRTLFFFFLLTSCIAPGAGPVCACIMAGILAAAGSVRQDQRLFVTGNPLLQAASLSNNGEEALHVPLVTLMPGLNADRLSSMILGIKNHSNSAGCRALLARCRQHEDPLVQLHAQAALAQDEEAHERMRMRIEACLEAYPENHFANKALAELCLSVAQRYAASPVNARPHLEKALRHIRAAQKNLPADVRLLTLEAQCHGGLRDSGSLRSACCLLHTTDSSGRCAAGAELDLAFNERRWEDVAACAGELDATNPSLKAAQAFWQKQSAGE